MIPLAHFTADEFSAPESMRAGFLRKLDQAREIAGVPFKITSSFRDGDLGAHGRGYAVDVRCRTSRARFHILRGAIEAGFRRIGVYDRHIHLDDDPSLPDAVVWWGMSS